MLPLGPVLRLRLKGSEWNLLSLDKEVEGGALGGEAWLKSGGVSVRDLAGSSPTEGEKQTKNHLSLLQMLYSQTACMWSYDTFRTC